MDERIYRALARGHTIDMTTTGRHTGQARRIEIFFHNIDGRIYVSGMPRPERKRAWLYNLESDPRMTLHLNGAVVADLPARARVIDDEAERRSIMPAIAANWNRSDVENMVRWSPLIEVTLDDTRALIGMSERRT